MERENKEAYFSEFSFLNPNQQELVNRKSTPDQLSDLIRLNIGMEGRIAYELWRTGKKRDLYSALRKIPSCEMLSVYMSMSDDIVSSMAVAVSLKGFPIKTVWRFTTDINTIFFQVVRGIPFDKFPWKDALTLRIARLTNSIMNEIVDSTGPSEKDLRKKN